MEGRNPLERKQRPACSTSSSTSSWPFLHIHWFFDNPSGVSQWENSCWAFTTVRPFIIHQPLRKQLLSIHNRSSLYHPSANKKTAAEHSQPFVPLSSISQWENSCWVFSLGIILLAYLKLSVFILGSVVNPECFSTEPHPDPTFQVIPDSDQDSTFKTGPTKF